MSEGTRGSADGQQADVEQSTDRWLAADPVLDAELPDDVRAALGRVLGEEPVETLDDWLGEGRRRRRTRTDTLRPNAPP